MPAERQQAVTTSGRRAAAPARRRGSRRRRAVAATRVPGSSRRAASVQPIARTPTTASSYTSGCQYAARVPVRLIQREVSAGSTRTDVGDEPWLAVAQDGKGTGRGPLLGQRLAVGQHARRRGVAQMVAVGLEKEREGRAADLHGSVADGGPHRRQVGLSGEL